MPRWLLAHRTSLAATTYDAGKLLLFGALSPERLGVFVRDIDRVMGIARQGADLHLASRWQLWRFRNLLLPGQLHQGHDAVYTPRTSHVTGAVDVHDMAVEADGRLVFVATAFNCIATPDADHSFRPVWAPPWMPGPAVAGDACHLNGLALREGRLRYATAVSRATEADGWRAHRADGGVVVDVATGAVLAEGLSMPHSPRWVGDSLLVLESGRGRLLAIGPDGGAPEVVCALPGYARGMTIVGGFAVVGLSLCREGRTFADLPLADELARQGVEPLCGLLVVDLARRAVVEWIRLEDPVREFYDVVALPGVVRPMAIGFKGEEIERHVSLPPENP